MRAALVDAALPVVLVSALVASAAAQTAEALVVAVVARIAAALAVVVVLVGSSAVALAQPAVVLGRLLPRKPCHCLECYL